MSAVKVYKSLGEDMVHLTEYRVLLTALREALDGWEDSESQHDHPIDTDRIAELRKFLDDK